MKNLLHNLHKLIAAKNNAMSASTKEAYKKTSLENIIAVDDIGQGFEDGAKATGDGLAQVGRCCCIYCNKGCH